MNEGNRLSYLGLHLNFVIVFIGKHQYTSWLQTPVDIQLKVFVVVDYDVPLSLKKCLIFKFVKFTNAICTLAIKTGFDKLLKWNALNYYGIIVINSNDQSHSVISPGLSMSAFVTTWASWLGLFCYQKSHQQNHSFNILQCYEGT